MVIGGIHTFQIVSLCQLGNEDMVALVIYALQGVDLRRDGSLSQWNDTVKGLSGGGGGVKCYCEVPLIG